MIKVTGDLQHINRNTHKIVFIVMCFSCSLYFVKQLNIKIKDNLRVVSLMKLK